jgi:hypothetical protein
MKQQLVTEDLRVGDIERAMLEWRSLLRQISYAPDLEDWPRWMELKRRARIETGELESQSHPALPGLTALQMKRIEHSLGRSGVVHRRL